MSFKNEQRFGRNSFEHCFRQWKKTKKEYRNSMVWQSYILVYVCKNKYLFRIGYFIYFTFISLNAQCSIQQLKVSSNIFLYFFFCRSGMFLDYLQTLCQLFQSLITLTHISFPRLSSSTSGIKWPSKRQLHKVQWLG